MPATRREIMTMAAGAALASVARPAFATDDPAIKAFTRGAAPSATGISLDIAATVENGAYVNTAIAVDSTMTGDDFVEAVLLVAPHNPRPVIAEFAFGDASGRARVATRIRLARSQVVSAFARLRDGSVRVARQTVTVAVGGCDI
jgi:sulfur-oxidizing protein SoxY